MGDFNGDGKLDIATVSFTSGMRVYPGNGDGTFAPFVDFPGARDGQNVAAADFNADGKSDIAIATGGSLKVILAQAPGTPGPVSPSNLTVSIGAGSHKSITYLDADGSPAIITLSGAGAADILLTGPNLSLDESGNRVIGGPAALTSIATTGTTSATSLSIDAKGKNGRLNIGAISTDGSLKSITAARANLTGTVNVAGTVGALTFNNVSGGSITLNGTGPAVNVSLGSVRDETLVSRQPINTLAVGQWYTTGAAASTGIQAPSINQITSAELFGANLTLGSLGSFDGRGISQGTWTIGGAVGTIHVRRDAQITLSAASIGTLSAGNTLNNLVIDTTGNIGTIVAAAMTNCTILAGISALPPGERLPTSAADLLSPASIGSITLGHREHLASFLNNAIAAATLGQLSLGSIGFSNGGQPQGLAARSISRFSGVDISTGKSFSVVNPVDLTRLAARGINTGDFVLRIL